MESRMVFFVAHLVCFNLIVQLNPPHSGALEPQANFDDANLVEASLRTKTRNLQFKHQKIKIETYSLKHRV